METTETAGAPESAPTVQCPNCGYEVTIPQVAPGERAARPQEPDKRVTPLPSLAKK